MVQVIEALYSEGKVLIDNINIPDNSKVLILWDPKGFDVDTVNKKVLPEGILLSEITNIKSDLRSLPEDAVEFQRRIRDEEW